MTMSVMMEVDYYRCMTGVAPTYSSPPTRI